MKWRILFILLLTQPVVAHTEEEPQGFGWTTYLMTLGVIIAILTLGLLGVKRLETQPGTLPIRKLTIAAAITVLINAIVLGVLYLGVLS